MSHQDQVAHLFRHEYGQLVALLVRRTSIHHLEAVEDAVQWAMTQALDLWKHSDTPNNPSGWLYKVAYRRLLSEFRANQRKQELLANSLEIDDYRLETPIDIPLSGEMHDSLLRMLFVACNDKVPVESQLIFTLKSLCGFSIPEISLRLFITEANAYKRFSRARQHLKNQTAALDTLKDAEIIDRLPSVHRVLYLVFTEGYLSSHPDTAIRKDLCEEAIRLTLLLSKSTLGDMPESYALLALMYFNIARINTRQDDSGLLLLDQQDRSQWSTSYISMGLGCLERSARGETISRYHVEAGIAAEHCLSQSFVQTRWDKIVASYELLERIAPSPLHQLNRALALAEWKNPQEGLAVLISTDLPNWLERSYHWYAVLADLQYRCGEHALAHKNENLAIQTAPNNSIKKLLSKRFMTYKFSNNEKK